MEEGKVMGGEAKERKGKRELRTEGALGDTEDLCVQWVDTT